MLLLPPLDAKDALGPAKTAAVTRSVQPRPGSSEAGCHRARCRAEPIESILRPPPLPNQTESPRSFRPEAPVISTVRSLEFSDRIGNTSARRLVATKLGFDRTWPFDRMRA